MSKSFFALHNRLMKLIDEGSDIFMRERPFLEDGGTPRIESLEEATQNQLEIELTARAIQSELKKTLPKILPPKQQDMF